ncbi:helix-turn-helix domain-containing protein [Campylobacter sp. RM16192]|uniref:helix-turn-helix domain-containing protein n=1 Tax=Campylobacter sp. RM16192 TaxID=1660080 RepID=UPI001451C4E4|nr:helix-turn-helix domain-containing protein [Campylobacter sp. RM16192]QCD52114.1 hypothetical protein CDOMC_0467 [Campylobacter sp. RM16192]
MIENLITPEQFCLMYGVPIQTQAKWRMKKGDGIKLPYIKLGRRVFYKRDSIEALVNSLEVNSIASINTNTIKDKR